MSKMIQIRNVPDALHRKLKARAARAGMSLSEYLLREIRELESLPTIEEWLDRTEFRSPVEVSLTPAQIIREERSKRLACPR